MQDTKLEVLGQVFVVHSILLKLHSKFFLRFLDSPEKDGRPAGTEWNLMHLVPVLTLIAGGMFRECVVWICAEWKCPLVQSILKGLKIEHPTIHKVAERAWSQRAVQVTEVYDQLFEWKSDEGYQRMLANARFKSVGSADFFHRICNDCPDKIKTNIERLLQNRLVFSRKKKELPTRFFSAVVEDEDLPWDLNEVEW